MTELIPKSLIKKFFHRVRGNEYHKPIDFKVGMVIKMEPGYYTTEPYYVLIKEVTSTGITTTIPGYHDMKIDQISDWRTWEYQVARMTVVGNEETHGGLLYNQELPKP